MSKSSTSARPSKPDKPRPDFPLFAHATRRWAKKVRGKFHYFGPWDDPDGALDEWLRVKDYLLAGKTPPPADDQRVTVHQLANLFLIAKEARVNSGEVASRTFADYKATFDTVLSTFGKLAIVEDLTPSDFQALRATLAKRYGPTRLGNEIQRVCSLFLFAFKSDHISRPVKFGDFKKPTKATMRPLLREARNRGLDPHEVRTLLEVAGVHGRAMILLGVNCAFGNGDIGLIEKSHLDLAGGWVDFPRPKTGIPRRAKLWPETVAAIELSLQHRRDAKDAAARSRVFITKRGLSWYKDTPDNPVAKQASKWFDAAGIDKPGVKFYAPRRCFETAAGETGDQVAVNLVTGHQPGDDDIASIYRQSISDKRLVKVSEAVRTWLWPEGSEAAHLAACEEGGARHE